MQHTLKKIPINSEFNIGNNMGNLVMGISIGNLSSYSLYTSVSRTVQVNKQQTAQTTSLNCAKVNSDAAYLKSVAPTTVSTAKIASKSTVANVVAPKTLSETSKPSDVNPFSNASGFVDPTAGYTKVDGCKYTKDGKTYYFNERSKKMETKEERIKSSLDMAKEYIENLHKNLPKNSYVTKLYNLIENSENAIADDISTTAGIQIGEFKIGGFGGFGKITLADEVFNSDSIAATASTILHEMIHYSDNDNITSKTEEMDAYAIQSGMLKYYGCSSYDETEMINNINKGYAVDLKEASQHKLDDSTMNELRDYLGYGANIRAKLADDNLLNSLSGGFINGAGTVLGAGIQLGGAIGGAIGGKTGEAVGRVVGGIIAAAPAIVVGAVVAVGTAVVTAAKAVGNFFKKLFG